MGGFAAAVPYIMQAAAAAVSVVGGVMQADQARQAGKAQSSAFEAQAKAQEANAKNQAAQEKDRYQRLAASQRAQYGASGVDVNRGSPIDVLADTDAEGEMSAMQLLYSGELEAWNSRQRAKAARAEAESTAKSAILGGILGGISKGASAFGGMAGAAGSAAPGASPAGSRYMPHLMHDWRA